MSKNRVDAEDHDKAEADEAAQLDAEAAGVQEFLDMEEKRGMKYYYIRLGFILILPLMLTLGMTVYEVAHAVDVLAYITSWRIFLERSLAGGKLTIALAQEMWAAANLISSIDRQVAELQMQEATGLTNSSLSAVDWTGLAYRDRVFANSDEARQVLETLRASVRTAAPADIGRISTEYAALSATSLNKANPEPLYLIDNSLEMEARSSKYMRLYQLNWLYSGSLGLWYFASCSDNWPRWDGWGLMARIEGNRKVCRDEASRSGAIARDLFNRILPESASGPLLRSLRNGIMQPESSLCRNRTELQLAASSRAFIFGVNQYYRLVQEQYRQVSDSFTARVQKDYNNALAILPVLCLALPFGIILTAAISKYYSKQLRDNRDDRIGLAELIVAKRMQIAESKQQADELIKTMLPKQIADALRRGITPKPTEYPQATVFFSCIANFKSIIGRSRPLDIMEFLNVVYRNFDAKIDCHDVYKVETVADTYMVVSGVPECNGDRHISEIANMSLELMLSAKTTVVDHLPEERVELKCGINTGSVVSGVMGNKSPRYCMFGDTVNTASRMCSHSLEFRIHASSAAGALLKAQGFEIQSRGEIDIKGKGMMETFWLLAPPKTKPKQTLRVHFPAQE